MERFGEKAACPALRAPHGYKLKPWVLHQRANETLAHQPRGPEHRHPALACT
jgi:hypothetical protein